MVGQEGFRQGEITDGIRRKTGGGMLHRQEPEEQSWNSRRYEKKGGYRENYFFQRRVPEQRQLTPLYREIWTFSNSSEGNQRLTWSSFKKAVWGAISLS